MIRPYDPWHEALLLKSTLLDLGIEDGEITFSGLEHGTLCFLSETLSDDPSLTPSMAELLRTTLERVREPLEGYSIRLQEGRLSMSEQDSGDYLVAWN